ncbi:MAG: Uma2 family endonuclease [candidate division KSB1 bacterium]|nr:Uma2 family endonuclease [candidate division KSB1 bacterium]
MAAPPSSVEQMPDWMVIVAENMPNMDALVTEDDTPVDNIFSAKQQRLLVEPLYSSWAGPGEGRVFLADANVGVFYAVSQPPLVPDAFLSIDVRAPADPWPKAHRSYFIWMYGKPPDVVIEVVSNQKGAEDERKLRIYAQIGVTYYVIFDPTGQLGTEPLRIYRLHEGVYHQSQEGWFPRVGLGVRLWHGVYEDMEQTWLRWCDREGNVVPTGAERAATAQDQAEQERQRAEQERQRAEQERQRAERLVVQLRALGVEPQET